MRLTPFRYYRCHECNNRMLRRRRPDERRSSPRVQWEAVLYYAKVLAIVVFVIVVLYLLAGPYFDIGQPRPRHR